MFFKFAPGLGPRTWRFRDPTTCFSFHANSLNDICKHIREYRKQNELEELQFLETVVENYNCKLKDNIGACTQREPFKRGIFQSVRGGVSLLESLLYNKMVSQEVADSRAAVCKDCPKNIFPDKGPFIKWADKLAEASTGGKKVKDYDSLGNCEVCTCCMKAKVWYTGPFKFKKEQMDEFPDFCWQKKEALKNG